MRLPALDSAQVVGERAADAVRHVTDDLAHEARRARTLASEVVEDGLHAAKRAYKVAKRDAADWRDDTTDCIKREPVASVAAAFGGGVIVGAVGMWLAALSRRPRR